jgi:hypothetical protein
MWCVEFFGIDVSNEEMTRANRARAVNSLGKSFGGRDRGRTGDLIVANDALSQLSYSPTSSKAILTRMLEVENLRFDTRGTDFEKTRKVQEPRFKVRT